jgi:hypothetical protein
MRVNLALMQPIVGWAQENYKTFRPNGFGRQYGFLDEFDPPSEAWEIKRQIVEGNALQNAEQEPTFRDFCGFITAGGSIHQHQDSGSNGKMHVRFNVMVQKPASGGMPVQAGVELCVQEGDVWRCNASQVMHWCTPVVGSKPRIVLSFGFLL